MVGLAGRSGRYGAPGGRLLHGAGTVQGDPLDELDEPPATRPRRPLDYEAALRAHLRGACAARVALAAGSTATSRRNLRRVGLKIVARLQRRYDVQATFDGLGFTLDDFCRNLVKMLDATKRSYRAYRGRWFMCGEDPDNGAQAAACWLYMAATGIGGRRRGMSPAAIACCRSPRS
jgi:hypothetical protein